MKRLLFALMVLCLPFLCNAQSKEVSPDQALDIANSFWPKAKGGETPDAKLAFVEKDSTTDHPYYYVFNRGDDKGFIIISGDNRIKKIIGYADKGSFDTTNIPEQMKGMLAFYKEELKDIAATPDSLLKMDFSQFTRSKAMSKGAASYAGSVAPLLGNINYNQSAPYNLLCPVMWNQHCVTGCVATAGAQILKYHEYPKQGSGKSHSYVFNGNSFGTNFSGYYDWNNTLPYYNGNESPQQQNAISVIMQHLGVACDMNYSPNSSSADTYKLAASLSNYFNYDNGIQAYKRAFFLQSDWINYLKRELNAGRPVIMTGQGSGGGHAFVCDGYDANGLFHINWGWAGQSNGYFSIDYLSPSALGAGGGSGGYNDDVTFFGGIRPPVQGSKYVHFIAIEGLTINTSISRNGRFYFKGKNVDNIGLRRFVGKVGVALYKNGKFYKLLGSRDMTIESQEYYYEVTIDNLYIPSDVPEGRYNGVFVYKSNDDNVWRACLSSKGIYNCTDVDVSSSTVNFAFNYKTRINDLDNGGNNYTPTNGGGNNGGGNNGGGTPTVQTREAILSMLSVIKMPNNTLTSDNISISASISNKGNVAYSGKLGAFIYSSDGKTYINTVKAQSVNIPAGSNQTINFTGSCTLNPGKYMVAVFATNKSQQWEQIQSKDMSCILFNRAAANNVPVNNVPVPNNNAVYRNDDVNEDYDDVINEANDLINADDYYSDNNDIDQGADTEGNDEILCQEFFLQGNQAQMEEGYKLYTLNSGASGVVQLKLKNVTNSAISKIICVSVMNLDGEWMCDLLRQTVTLQASSSKTIAGNVSFEDLPEGSYFMAITEEVGEDAYSISPDTISTIILDIQ